MIAGDYNFKTHVAGDTFEGVQITLTLTSGETTSPIDLTGSTIKLQFIKVGNTAVASTLEIGSGITVDDAANGIFSIDPFTVWSDDGIYEYDVQVTNGSTVKTYMKGEFKVTEQTTT